MEEGCYLAKVFLQWNLLAAWSERRVKKKYNLWCLCLENNCMASINIKNWRVKMYMGIGILLCFGRINFKVLSNTILLIILILENNSMLVSSFITRLFIHFWFKKMTVFQNDLSFHFHKNFIKLFLIIII